MLQWVVGTCLALTATLQATVITFDDLPVADTYGAYEVVPNGYAGLNWSNFQYLNGYTATGYLASGYHAAVVSPNNVAFNTSGNPAALSLSSINPFDLQSGYFTAAWNDNLSVTATGYRNSVRVAQTSFILSATAPALEILNFAGVDSVTFSSSGGTPHYYNNPGTQFAVDNLVLVYKNTISFYDDSPPPFFLGHWPRFPGNDPS